MDGSAVSTNCDGLAAALSMPSPDWDTIAPQNTVQFVSRCSEGLGTSTETFFFPLLSAVAAVLGRKATININDFWPEPPIIWTAILVDDRCRKKSAVQRFINASITEAMNYLTSEHAQEIFLTGDPDSTLSAASVPTVSLMSDPEFGVEEIATRCKDGAVESFLFTRDLGRIYRAFQLGGDEGTSDAKKHKTQVNNECFFDLQSTGQSPWPDEFGGSSSDARFNLTGFVKLEDTIRMINSSDASRHFMESTLAIITAKPEKVYLKNNVPMLAPILFKLRKEHQTMKVYSLDDAAHAAFASYYNDIEERLHRMSNVDSSMLQRVLSKSQGHVARLALVLHCLDNVIREVCDQEQPQQKFENQESIPGKISAGIMYNAINLMRMCICHKSQLLNAAALAESQLVIPRVVSVQSQTQTTAAQEPRNQQKTSSRSATLERRIPYSTGVKNARVNAPAETRPVKISVSKQSRDIVTDPPSPKISAPSRLPAANQISAANRRPAANQLPPANRPPPANQITSSPQSSAANQRPLVDKISVHPILSTTNHISAPPRLSTGNQPSAPPQLSPANQLSAPQLSASNQFSESTQLSAPTQQRPHPIGITVNKPDALPPKLTSFVPIRPKAPVVSMNEELGGPHIVQVSYTPLGSTVPVSAQPQTSSTFNNSVPLNEIASAQSYTIASSLPPVYTLHHHPTSSFNTNPSPSSIMSPAVVKALGRKLQKKRPASIFPSHERNSKNNEYRNFLEICPSKTRRVLTLGMNTLEAVWVAQRKLIQPVIDTTGGAVGRRSQKFPTNAARAFLSALADAGLGEMISRSGCRSGKSTFRKRKYQDLSPSALDILTKLNITKQQYSYVKIYNRIGHEDRERLIEIFETGRDYREMADTLGIKHSTARSIITSYTTTRRTKKLLIGGPRNIKMDEEMKNRVDKSLQDNPMTTLEQMQQDLREYMPQKPPVSTSTIARTLDGMMFSMKMLEDVRDVRNSPRVLQQREQYANWFMETGVMSHCVFVGETGYNVWTRRSRGRGPRNGPRRRDVHGQRGKNCNVTFAVSDEIGLVNHTIACETVTTDTFEQFLIGTARQCEQIFPPDKPVYIIYDNARPHVRAQLPFGMHPSINLKLLPPYSRFLNPTEMAHSAFKAAVKEDLGRPEMQQRLDDREAAREAGDNLQQWRCRQLALVAQRNIDAITQEKCSNWYQQSQSYMPRCLTLEIING